MKCLWFMFNNTQPIVWKDGHLATNGHNNVKCFSSAPIWKSLRNQYVDSVVQFRKIASSRDSALEFTMRINRGYECLITGQPNKEPTFTRTSHVIYPSHGKPKNKECENISGFRCCMALERKDKWFDSSSFSGIKILSLNNRIVRFGFNVSDFLVS